MAESVQKILEKSSPFFLALKKSDLFEYQELKRLISSVKNYENKLHSNPKTLENYNQAIRFEITTFHDFLKRYRARHAKDSVPKEKYMFIQRILALYRRGLKYFKDNWNFNMKYFECLEIYRLLPDHVHIAHDHMMSMLQTFSHEPLIYRKAAGWFCSCKMYTDAGRALMLGQSRHPKNLQIYFDLFELEVSINKQIPGSEKRLEKYIDQAICHIDSYHYFFALMELMDQHEVLRPALKYIRRRMVSKFKDESEVWDFVAKRELGAEVSMITKGKIGPDTLRGIQHMVLRYREGILKVPENKKLPIWIRLVETMSKTTHQYCTVETVSLLKETLRDAEEAGVKLEEWHYVNLIECEDNPKLAEETFLRGLKKHNRSEMLWLAYLKYVASQPHGDASIVFDKSVIALGPKAFKIFDFYEIYVVLRNCDAGIQTFYERAIVQPCPKTVEVFKARYLSWAIAMKSKEEVREIYFRIVQDPPYSKRLHEDMFISEQLELLRDKETNRRRDVVDIWLKQFGHEDVNVWFQKLELIKEECEPDMQEEIRKLYESAVKSLEPEKIDLFKERFANKNLPVRKENDKESFACSIPYDFDI